MIKCYHCKGIHTTVALVKDCANVTAEMAKKVQIGTIVETVIPATVEHKVTVPAHRLDAKYLALKAKVQTGTIVEEVKMVKIPGLDISVPTVKTIDHQVAEHDAALAEIKKGQDLELGMYQHEGVVYKVKWNKYKTYKLAEKLVITEQYGEYDAAAGAWTKTPKGKFYYAKGMMAILTSEHKMTEADAKAFHDATKLKYGQDYGFCCVCGKLLTNKKSIAKGIGPVCDKNF